MNPLENFIAISLYLWVMFPVAGWSIFLSVIVAICYFFYYLGKPHK